MVRWSRAYPMMCSSPMRMAGAGWPRFDRTSQRFSCPCVNNRMPVYVPIVPLPHMFRLSFLRANAYSHLQTVAPCPQLLRCSHTRKAGSLCPHTSWPCLSSRHLLICHNVPSSVSSLKASKWIMRLCHHTLLIRVIHNCKHSFMSSHVFPHQHAV